MLVLMQASWARHRGLKMTAKNAKQDFVAESNLRLPEEKNGSFSLIERVILSAGAMLIFSVSFQIDQMFRRTKAYKNKKYI